MKTDPSIHTFLATGPEAFRMLTGGLTLAGDRQVVAGDVWRGRVGRREAGLRDEDREKT
jgi:hypothetical protein